MQFGATLVLPVLVLGVLAEFVWREYWVRQDYSQIKETKNGDTGERMAVLDLADGCWAKEPYALIPKYFRERRFGNCRSLNSTDLEKASLDRADLRGATLDRANLKNVQFGCFTLFEKSECTNLENIKWNDNTQWEGIQGWDKVKNIPPALKKQLGLR